MKENFPLAVGFVLKHEGGYVDDPSDPGGATNFGIAQRYHPNEDIKNMTIDRAAQIYKTDYWDACNCDTLAFPKDIIAMDTAVNCGKEEALIAANSGDTIEEMLFERARYYMQKVVAQPAKMKFFFGWMERIIELKQLIHDEQKRRN